MSREILFKAKRKSDGEWVEGIYYKQEFYYGEPCEKHYIITSTECLGYDLELDEQEILPETLCEFTGLYDKNGKKIFEGDIVCSDRHKDLNCVFYGKHDISCCGCCYSSHQSVGFYISKTENALTSADEDEWEIWEVVSNRFDNPELLTAERTDDK